jgi:hypothetical protein
VDRNKLVLRKKSRFTEHFIRANGLKKQEFDEWVFLPGMMFQAPDKWWGKRGKRNRPHEGLDLCIYRARQNRICHLKETSRIPAIYSGVVVKILDDFLGKSVIMAHTEPADKNLIFLTIFGHTQPAAGIEAGSFLHQGDVMASVADPGRSGIGVISHVHISIGFFLKTIPYDQLNWDSIGKADVISLLDPVLVLNAKYSVMETTRVTGTGQRIDDTSNQFSHGF